MKKHEWAKHLVDDCRKCIHCGVLWWEIVPAEPCEGVNEGLSALGVVEVQLREWQARAQTAELRAASLSIALRDVLGAMAQFAVIGPGAYERARLALVANERA